MNVGYYFHPQAVFDADGSAKTEAHWGYFIRALAGEVGSVTFYAHAGPFSGTETLPLRAEDSIRCVDLGPRRQRPLMYLWPRPNMRAFKPKADGLDAMVVRAPTSLLPAFARRCRRAGIPVIPLLVDDTSNWRDTAIFPGWRNRLIRLWLWWQQKAQDRVASKTLTLAISRSIVRGASYKRTAIVPTTSLSRADLTGPAGRTRAWPTKGERIRLLFTGRLAEEKGLLELGEALTMLVADGHNVEIEFVGGTYGDSTIDTVLAKAEADGVRDRIIVSGFLEAGPALLAAYARADVYVLPTYGEGSVTRTIKEAFATGVPVVSTTIRENTEFLTDGEHAVLVPMRSAAELAKGIERVIGDAALRTRMTAAGFEWVQGYTNERSGELVAGHVRDEIARLAKR